MQFYLEKWILFRLVMLMSVVAIDGKGFLRKGFRSSDGKYSEFRAVLGTAVKTKAKDDFKEEYDKILGKLCKKYKMVRTREVLKSYDILSDLKYPKGPKFLEDFFKGIRDHVDSITIYYTTIPSTKIPRIKKYGADKTGVDFADPITFLKELEPSYPHCCAWRYINEHPEDALTPINIDYFEGELTDAWKQIRTLPNIRVYIAGDECNCYISTADIITKLVDLRLYKKRMTLYKTCISDCFPDYDCKIDFIDQLRFISPISREKIDISTKLAHPVIFILKEGLHAEVVGPAKERDVIALSPLMNKVFDKSFEVDGCAKFFDVSRDRKLIEDGDYFLCLGDKGLETANYLNNLGYKFQILLPGQI